ncbi:MAG: rod shape-determining protein RodA [Azospirillaceae bacterium]|nr:rod shape-determining protein RodA [Azospirillaceae bacterium]
MRLELGADQSRMSLLEKVWQINWGLVLVLCALTAIGLTALYSAANGRFDPWASRQLIRFGFGVVVMLAVALVDIRIWLRAAYPIYFLALALLVLVDVAGQIGMGAQRWIDLGVIQLQPSEVMKIAIVLALARFFHGASQEDVGRTAFLMIPGAMILTPVALVLKQPDLGTAMMLMAVGGAMLFLAGVQLWKFGVVAALGIGAIPIAWQFLREYQRKRVLTFLNPESDPLGAGYHIMQSKIALGSGGLAGKGFLMGTQSHLNFLPEKQTDFIFTMLAEEFGMVGGVVLLSLYSLLLVYGIIIALGCRNHFGRLLSLGLTTNLFLYVFINIAMVMGLIPVVGVPLPLISYGGTAMLTVLFGFGLVMSVHIHREVRIHRRAMLGDL